MNPGWTNPPSTAPNRTSDPAAMRTCRSSDIAFLPRTTGKPASIQASVPPYVDDVREASLLKRLARLLASASGSADDVKRLGRAVALAHECCRIESIERHIPSDFDVDFPIFDRRSHIDDVGRMAVGTKFRKRTRVDCSDCHGSFLGVLTRYRGTSRSTLGGWRVSGS